MAGSLTPPADVIVVGCLYLVFEATLEDGVPRERAGPSADFLVQRVKLWTPRPWQERLSPLPSRPVLMLLSLSLSSPSLSCAHSPLPCAGPELVKPHS